MNDLVKNNKPYWLPQVSAPFDYITKQLKQEEIPYSVYNISNNELKPIQKEVNPDTVEFFKGVYKRNSKKYPIFVSGDNEILDGHNRFVAHKMVKGDNKPISCFKIDCDSKCAARILNKIQDKFEFERENNNKLEPISKFLDKPEIGWYDTAKDVDYICYREKPIKENSESGNFFYLKNEDSFKKYKITFDKIMILPNSCLENNKLPMMWLADKLLPNKDFDIIAMNNNISLQSAVNREIVKKCKEMGLDGINYGDKIIQTI
jgi:hypothetical protein